MVKEAGTLSQNEHNPLQTVLVVEDDVHIGAFLIEAITQETPYDALLDGSGAEALETVKSLKPGLLVLDYHLPGINGLQLYDRLHAIKELAHVPAIMVSAVLPEQELKQRKIIGIKKPFELDTLLDAIDQLVA